MEKFRNKKVLLLGFGVENQSLYNFLSDNGAKITVADRDESFAKLANKFPKVVWQIGKNYLKGLEKFDFIFRSPGVPFKTKEIHAAKERGTQITSAIKLFFDLCPAEIIGVTGTKGKGTTATLIAEILRENFRGKKNIFLAGNIGKPAMDFYGQIKPNDIVILELSSFQLQDLTSSPHIAVVLNVTSDHLDHHGSLKEYVLAKQSIVKYQSKNDFAVFSADSLNAIRFAELTRAKTYFFSRNKSVDEGAFIDWQVVDLRREKHGLGKIVLRVGGKDEILASASEILLRGEHNLENICAAALASFLSGASPKIISKVIKEFKGLEHRLELVAEKNGVKYYNDSFATNPDPTIAAVQSFIEPVILIAGGSSKKADFSELGWVIARNSTVKSVILLGKEEAPKIRQAIEKAKLKGQKEPDFWEAFSMEEAVATARRLATPGDVVLLSPACASFDLFHDYKERGKKFKRAVLKNSN